MAELIIIGCRAGSPGSCGPATGFLIEHEAGRILVDCGPGVVAGLANLDLLAGIDAVIVTHRHADHCSDLVALAYHRLFPQRRARIPLYTSASVHDVVRQLDQTFGIPSLEELREPIQQALELHTVSVGETFEVLGLRVETTRTVHPVETMAIRFPDLGFAFTSDAAATPDLVEFVRGSEVLLAEGTYLSGEGRDLGGHGHMTAACVGDLARSAAVGRLVVTHFSECSEREATRALAQEHFRGPVVAAAPNLRVRLR